jgi:hypothetical protein
MPLQLLVDVEQLVIGYLAGQADVATLVSGRVFPKRQEKQVYPAVIAFRLGGIPMYPHWSDPARIHFDCWADLGASNPERQAWQIAATVQSALQLLIATTRGSVFVTHVEDVLGFTRLPDPVTGRARVLFEQIVRVHPVP